MLQVADIHVEMPVQQVAAEDLQQAICEKLADTKFKGKFSKMDDQISDINGQLYKQRLAKLEEFRSQMHSVLQDVDKINNEVVKDFEDLKRWSVNDQQSDLQSSLFKDNSDEFLNLLKNPEGAVNGQIDIEKQKWERQKA